MGLLEILKDSMPITYHEDSPEISSKMFFNQIKQYNKGITLMCEGEFGGANILTLRNVENVKFNTYEKYGKSYLIINGIKGKFELNKKKF